MSDNKAKLTHDLWCAKCRKQVNKIDLPAVPLFAGAKLFSIGSPLPKSTAVHFICADCGEKNEVNLIVTDEKITGIKQANL